MLVIVNCTCGESICRHDGRCKGCGKYRMLPSELEDKAKAIEKAVDDFRESVIAWMNANTSATDSRDASTVRGQVGGTITKEG